MHRRSHLIFNDFYSTVLQWWKKQRLESPRRNNCSVGWYASVAEVILWVDQTCHLLWRCWSTSPGWCARLHPRHLIQVPRPIILVYCANTIVMVQVLQLNSVDDNASTAEIARKALCLSMLIKKQNNRPSSLRSTSHIWKSGLHYGTYEFEGTNLF